MTAGELETWDDVLNVARMLVDVGGLETAQDVIYFFEKPHKWRDEVEAWRRAGYPSRDDPGWDVFERRITDMLDGV